MNKLTIQQAIDRSDIDRLDAQLILSFILNKPKSYLITWPEHTLSASEQTAFDLLVHKRSQGYPLAYIISKKSFWDMELIVTPDVLIPRPETELLVETALSRLSTGNKILELATGSGAIACSLAREKPDLNIIASDISEPALKIAKSNAEKYDLNQINFIQSNWFADIIPQQFDMIIANPPYLAETDSHLSSDIRFEPRNALVSGPAGDEHFMAIISQAPAYLKPQACLLLEHGACQGERVRALFNQHGFADIHTKKDLAGLERVTHAVLDSITTLI